MTSIKKRAYVALAAAALLALAAPATGAAKPQPLCQAPVCGG